MIPKYRLISERLRTELRAIEQVVARARDAVARAEPESDSRVFFVASAALDLHGFYVGLERLFELIAAFDLIRRDLTAFAEFLDTLSTADEDRDSQE